MPDTRLLHALSRRDPRPRSKEFYRPISLSECIVVYRAEGAPSSHSSDTSSTILRISLIRDRWDAAVRPDRVGVVLARFGVDAPLRQRTHEDLASAVDVGLGDRIRAADAGAGLAVPLERLEFPARHRYRPRFLVGVGQPKRHERLLPNKECQPQTAPNEECQIPYVDVPCRRTLTDAFVVREKLCFPVLCDRDCLGVSVRQGWVENLLCLLYLLR